LLGRPHGHRPEVLSDGEQATLINRIPRGLDPERDEPSSWTPPDLCHYRDAVQQDHMPAIHAAGCAAARVLQQNTRPTQSGMPAAEAFAKRRLRQAIAAAAAANPDERIALWFQDEVRVGRRSASGPDFCLVLPRVSTGAMNRFPADFAQTVPDDTHALMVLDGAS
jgi:hypothetical protein